MSNIDQKKDLILNCIKLGMDFMTSALCSSCTKEEIQELEEDEEFQRKIEIKNALTERELLEDHQSIIDEAVVRGNAAPIQWKLERINPERWGTKTKIAMDKSVMVPLTINMVKGSKEDA